jgi:tetratricopeptide (TPR) repeat protein
LIATTYYNLGVVYFSVSDYPHAIAAFSNAVAKDPTDAASLFNLAAACLVSGQQEKVPALRDHLRLLNPDMADELDTMIQKYSETKN